MRRESGVKSRFTHNFLIPPCCLLRRNGPVPGILAAITEGKIVNKSERRHEVVRSVKEKDGLANSHEFNKPARP